MTKTTLRRCHSGTTGQDVYGLGRQMPAIPEMRAPLQACYLPARGATRVDPLDALREV